MKNDNVNLNVSDQYIQPSRNYGSTTYYNIGTNTATIVPWGALDWTREIVATTMATAFYVGLFYFGGHLLKFW